MEVDTDVREMISQAFHEVYNSPIPTEALDELFQPSVAQKVEKIDLNYSAERIYDFITSFIESLKNSFGTPISYNEVFDCFSHTEGSQNLDKQYE